MDSGMALEEAQRPPFDPLAPLLPEEVGWILDRSISCEVTKKPPGHSHPLITSTDGMAHREHSFPDRVHISLWARRSEDASGVEFWGGVIPPDRACDRSVKGCCTRSHEEVWHCLDWNGQRWYTRCGRASLDPTRTNSNVL